MKLRCGPLSLPMQPQCKELFVLGSLLCPRCFEYKCSIFFILTSSFRGFHGGYPMIDMCKTVYEYFLQDKEVISEISDKSFS